MNLKYTPTDLSFRGLPVYVEPLLTVSQPRQLFSRGERIWLFLERLASKAGVRYPFRLVRTTEEVPNPGMYILGDLGIMMHPDTWDKLKREIPRE